VDALAWMFGPGLVDVVIAVTLLEGVLLAAYHRRTGRGVAPRDFLPGLVSGLLLMTALRAVLVGSAGVWLAAALLGAGVAHALDLHRRWR